jgi:hypothetical protein
VLNISPLIPGHPLPLTVKPSQSRLSAASAI